MRRPQAGVTLLEIMLVMAIFATLLMLGIRQAQSFAYSRDVAKINAVVDTLAYAAAKYYTANCNTLRTAQPIAIATLLPYMASQRYWQSIAGNNRLVNWQDPNAYIVQFNVIAPNTATSTACSSKDCIGTTGGAVTNTTLGATFKPVIVQIQVSVEISNSKYLNPVSSAVGASCTGVMSSTTGVVNSCSTASTAADNYWIFTRLPSYASPHSSASWWVMMPMVKQFNLLYTHDQMFELTTGTIVDNGTDSATNGYYVCGQ